MTEPPLCPACGRSVTPGEAVCFHCRAVLDPFTKGARISDRYVIEESIGQGGMGRVYRAYDEALHERVAIKTLLPEFSMNPIFLTRFRDEVRLARRVAHPNVCRVHDYVDHEGTPFLSMEWVEGETLAERLRRLGPRPEAELRIVRGDVTEALRGLWSNGIVHRDLKPANLMWTGSGRVKVMDFGLARALLEAGLRDRTSGVVGSPEYMSPEQIRGERATEKSDTYALGVTLFELATGHPPFRGGSPAQTLMKHLSDMPDATGLASLSEDLRAMILSSLEKNPALRPDLGAAGSDRAGEPKTIEAGAVRTPMRTKAWASLAGIAGVVAVVLYLRGSAPVPRVSSPVPSPVSPLSSPNQSATRAVQSEATGSGRATDVPPISHSQRLTPKTPQASVTPRSTMETPRGIGAPVPRTGPPATEVEMRSLPPSVPSPTMPSATTADVTASTSAPAPPPASVSIAKLIPTPTASVGARLVIVVTPWAEVFVNGDRKGLTPLPPLVLPAGAHVIELRHPDYRPFLRTIELKAGEQSRLSVNLRLEAIRR